MAAPFASKNFPRQGATFACLKGTSFPAQSEWAQYNAIYQAQLPTLTGFNSDSENTALKSAISISATAANIDPRVILAQVMQESHGNIHVICGDGGISCGVLQVQTSNPASCAEAVKGACPDDTITSMVQQGISHMQTSLASVGGDVPQGLRVYNSGKVFSSTDYSQAGTGTSSYVSSVGNLLRGVPWSAIPGCAGQLSQCGFKDVGC
ncbi:hypothetical protein MMC06_002934 [Schaereria dolodes]|nr:hypothetical protein [Schaereria dolodes]